MRSESRQKLSITALSGVMVLSGLVFAGGLILWAFQGDTSLATGEVMLVFAIAVALWFFIRRVVENSGFLLSNDCLEVGRPFGSLLIPYDKVRRVERVTRTGGDTTEKVRITFSQHGRMRKMDVVPESPSQLVYELVGRCPGLTASKKRRMKKDLTFRVAKEPLTNGVDDFPRGTRDPEQDW